MMWTAANASLGWVVQFANYAAVREAIETASKYSYL